MPGSIKVLQAIDKLPPKHVWEIVLPTSSETLYNLLQALVSAAGSPTYTAAVLLPLMRSVSDAENKLNNPDYNPDIFTVLYRYKGITGFTHLIIKNNQQGFNQEFEKEFKLLADLAGALDPKNYKTLSLAEQRRWKDYFIFLLPQFSGTPSQVVTACKSQCSGCMRQATDLKYCTVCLITRYCDEICQQVHWTAHKPVCKLLRQVNNVTKMELSLHASNVQAAKRGLARLTLSRDTYARITKTRS